MRSVRGPLIRLTITNITPEEADKVQAYALELARETDKKYLTTVQDPINNVVNLIDAKIKLDIAKFEGGKV